MSTSKTSTTSVTTSTLSSDAVSSDAVSSDTVSSGTVRAIGTLYFVIGKMGAGKSTFTSKFTENNSVILISEDDWLSELYPDEINNFQDFVVRHRKLLKVLKPHIQSILNSGSSVILDFPANTVDSRQWFITLAKEIAASHVAFFIDTPNDICLEQVAKRSKEQPERAKFDTPEMFEAVTKFFEEPESDENLNLIEISQN